MMTSQTWSTGAAISVLTCTWLMGADPNDPSIG